MTKYLNLVLEYGDNKNHCANHHIRNMLSFLVEFYGYKVCVYEDIINNIDNLTDYFHNIYGEYDVVNLLAYEGTTRFIDYIDKLNTVVNLGLIVDDIHQGKSLREPRKKIFAKTKYLFLTYAYHFERYFPRHKFLYFLPHSIAYQIEFNLNPIRKILVSGHLNKDIYPNRELMVELSKQNNNIILFKPDFSGYKITEKDYGKTYGYNYCRLLNSYLCCVADDSVLDRRYMICKFFEIMGYGSLLIAFNTNTLEIFKELGFVDGEHYFSINVDNYKEIISFVLDDKNIEQINKIRLNGYNHVNKYHHYSNRAKYLNKILTLQHNDLITSTDLITNTKYIKYVLE